MNMEPIGIIHTPFQDRRGMPIQPAGAEGRRGRVEIFEQYRDGLQDLEGFSHIILIYLFHKSAGFSLRVTPFMDDVERGVFSTRAPRRPNPIGLSTVELDRVENGSLYLERVDMLDGTPLLDIKPYVPEFEPATKVRIGWLERARGVVDAKRSDDRFVRRD